MTCERALPARIWGQQLVSCQISTSPDHQHCRTGRLVGPTLPNPEDQISRTRFPSFSFAFPTPQIPHRTTLRKRSGTAASRKRAPRSALSLVKTYAACDFSLPFGKSLHVLKSFLVAHIEHARADVIVAGPVDELGSQGGVVEPFEGITCLTGQMNHPTGAAMRGVAGVPIIHVQAASRKFVPRSQAQIAQFFREALAWLETPVEEAE